MGGRTSQTCSRIVRDLETAGCDTDSVRAAATPLPVRATVLNTTSCPSVKGILSAAVGAGSLGPSLESAETTLS